MNGRVVKAQRSRDGGGAFQFVRTLRLSAERLMRAGGWHAQPVVKDPILLPWDIIEQGRARMTSTDSGAARAQVAQWIEEGRTVLDLILQALNEADNLRKAVEVAQQECTRLQQEGAQLRTELGRLKADMERAQKEREKLTQWFTQVMAEAATRLRPPPPAA